MEHTKDYTLTVRQVLQNLGTLGDAYETVSRGGSPTGNYYFSVNAADAAATIKASQMLISQVPYWISVGERLPEPDHMGNAVGVLACLPDGERCIAFCDNDEYGVRWQCNSIQKPTHWMPLPEPPEVTK